MSTKFMRVLVATITSIAAFWYLFIATVPAGFAEGAAPTLDKCYTSPAYIGTAYPGHFTVTVSEAPVCTSGNYAAIYHLQSDGFYSVRYNTETWLCTISDPKDSSGHFQCLENGKFDAGTINVQNSANVSTYTRTPSELGFNNACGSYQTNFSFYYVDNNGLFCRFGSPREPLISTTCTTNANCAFPSPTPSPTIMPVSINVPIAASNSATQTPAPLSGGTLTKLPATGPMDNILFGLLSLIPAGLSLRKSSKIS